MRKVILSVILLLIATQILCASEITVGFENLQSVCGGQQTYDGCQVSSANPYLSQGLRINNGIITNQMYINNGAPTIFPFGSYYLNLNDNGGQETTWDFVNPWNGNAARNVNSVSFLVLGKNGNIISGSGSGTVGTDSEFPNNRICANPTECAGWLNGFQVVAINQTGFALLDAVVDPIPYGEAGYATGPQDFANFRVTLSVNPQSGGFSRLVFFQHPTGNDLGQVTWGGTIAIDQITFEEAVPEPGTFVGAGFAITALFAWRRRTARA